MFRAVASFTASNLTASAGTAILALIPPRRGAFTRITGVRYRCAGTAHTVTLMRTLGRTTLAANAAGGATSITLTSDPGSIEANDYVVVQLNDGRFFLTLVSAVSTLTCTITALPSAANAGNVVYFLGAPADHVSNQTIARPPTNTAGFFGGSAFLCATSALNVWEDFGAGICQTNVQGEPIAVHSGNGTAAGVLEQVSAVYTL